MYRTLKWYLRSAVIRNLSTHRLYKVPLGGKGENQIAVAFEIRSSAQTPVLVPACPIDFLMVKRSDWKSLLRWCRIGRNIRTCCSVEVFRASQQTPPLRRSTRSMVSCKQVTANKSRTRIYITATAPTLPHPITSRTRFINVYCPLGLPRPLTTRVHRVGLADGCDMQGNLYQTAPRPLPLALST